MFNVSILYLYCIVLMCCATWREGREGEETLLVCMSFGSRFAAISSTLCGVVTVCFKLLRTTYVCQKARLRLPLFGGGGVFVPDVVERVAPFHLSLITLQFVVDKHCSGCFPRGPVYP